MILFLKFDLNKRPNYNIVLLYQSINTPKNYSFHVGLSNSSNLIKISKR